MPKPLNPNNYHGWRTLSLRRDGHKCTQCGAFDRLEVDHIKPRSTHPELAYSLENSRTLCRPCHKLTDTYGGKQHLGKRLERNPYGPR